jgi:serine/threonine protein kinase
MADLEGGDPRQVGPYQVLGRLGSGGMGRVFLARSPGGRYVAVKVVRAELAEQADFRVRFAREVAAAQKVSGVFTAPVVDADLDAPVPWVATAYVAGPSLADAVTRHGPLPVASVLALAAGLAEGLGAIHGAGIVHRDLKPSNVLLAEDGPRVIDFGISRAAEESALTGTGLVVGSPGFMSPEQARGHPVGPPSDVFSLGALLSFAAAGEGPFGSGSTAVLLYRVVFEPPATERLPAELRPLIERCLAKDPRQRPGTAQLLAELNAHPATGWLPAPVTQGLPPHPPAGAGVIGDGAARPAIELAAPGRPLAPGAPDGPPTVTTSSLPPDATAGRFPPARRPAPAPQRRLLLHLPRHVRPTPARHPSRPAGQ